MLLLDRRIDTRVPLEMYLNTYVEDRPQRGFTANVSESGLYLSSLPELQPRPRAAVGLEFSLPGLGETIWAAGEMCYQALDDYFLGRGIRFVAMAQLHARMLQDYLRRTRLRRLLSSPRLVA